MTGMCLVASSRVMARVAWKPLVPGMTTSIRMRSGRSDFDLVIASSPFSAVTTWYPCLDSVSMKNCRSVGESSTIKIVFMAMAISSGTNGRVRPYGFQKTILREGLGQIFVRAHHSPARTIKQTVLGRQHDHGRVGEMCVFLDQRAGLIPVQARHHDVHEDDVGLVVGNLGERVETVFGEDHLATGLNQEDLRATANSVRIIDHHHLDAGKIRGFAHDLHPRKRPVFPVFRQFRRPSWAVARLHLVQVFTLYNQIQSKQSLVRCISEALSGSPTGTIATHGRCSTGWARTSKLDHFEVLLSRAAFGTSPVHRDILPTRPGRDPFLGEALLFVIDEAAYQAHPGFEILLFRHRVGMGYNESDRIIT